MEPGTHNKSLRLRVLTALMFIIGFTMWAGVPVAWLWIGSQVKASADSLGLAILVMSVGALATVIVLVRVLGLLNGAYREEFQVLNDDEPMRTPLEPVLVVSAGLAVVAFGVWFILFAGGGGPTIGPR